MLFRDDECGGTFQIPISRPSLNIQRAGISGNPPSDLMSDKYRNQQTKPVVSTHGQNFDRALSKVLVLLVYPGSSHTHEHRANLEKGIRDCMS